jgi:hypothetical protein
MGSFATGGPLCGCYHGCAGLYYAIDDDDIVHPEWVTCRNCLRIMRASSWNG